MQDLSLHLLDIAENSIRAGASLIKIEVIEDLVRNELVLKVEDNGKGMDQLMLEKVDNPFFTTRTTRRIGLGIPLLKQNCKLSNGDLVIRSQKGEGTQLIAVMQHDHIDRLPLGDLVGTLMILIGGNPKIDWVYHYSKGEQCTELDTRQIKEVLQGVPINHPEILEWIKAYLLSQMNEKD